jgi:hypothetical protein
MRDVPEFVKFSPRKAILDSCLLRRVSGIVISTKPASIRGFKTWFRNLVPTKSVSGLFDASKLSLP